MAPIYLTEEIKGSAGQSTSLPAIFVGTITRVTCVSRKTNNYKEDVKNNTRSPWSRPGRGAFTALGGTD